MQRLQQLGASMQTDFFPSANRWVYWMKNPFWSILLAASAAGICAYALNPWLWIPAALLVLLAIVGLALPAIAIRGVELRLFFDIRRTEVGRSVVVRLAAKNRWYFPVWGLSVVRGLSSGAAGHSTEGVSLARVPARSEVEYTWEFAPSERGSYPRGPVELETGFPFGLIRASRPAQVHGNLIVWPQTVSLKGLPDACNSNAEDDLSPRRAGDFGDVMGTRAFREGDSLRRVHWAQSARRQTLIVTERQAPQSSTVRVLVDLRPEAHESADAETTECLISAAASICRALHEQHCRVECHLGNRVYVAGEGVHGFHAMMDAFATCEVGDELRPSGRPGGFEITVTTASGFSGGKRSIVVQDASASDRGGAWMNIAGSDGLVHDFPGTWQGGCHVS